MVYCINPQCQAPDNVEDSEQCVSCGDALLYGQQHQRVMFQLHRNAARQKQTKRLFRVVDQQGREGMMEVFDAAFPMLAKQYELMAKLLRSVQHPGIPQYFEQFTITTGGGNRLNCLVREHIEGQDLQALVEADGAVATEKVLAWMKELGQILEAIHQKGFLHLDLKPANIVLRDNGLALIDFSEGAESLSAGYSPLEQAEGEPTTRSDIFALGRTLIHLLTGRHPLDIPKDPVTGDLAWFSLARAVPESLQQLLEQMIARDESDRPPSMAAILNLLETLRPEQGRPLSPAVTPTPRRMLLLSTLLGVLVGSGIALILPPTFNPLRSAIARIVSPQDYVACHPGQAETFSCGERSLLPGKMSTELKKQEGLRAFANQQYQEALEAFEEARQFSAYDPELLIFANNAQIKAQGLDAYTLVIAAPLNSRSYAQYILRGVAQLQTEINQSEEKIHGRSLQIMLANDGNDVKGVHRLAAQLVQKQNVVGVIGHYASEISEAAQSVYIKAQMPFISYGSTSTTLSCKNIQACNRNVFFRSVYTTSVTAQYLVTHARSQNIHQRIAVVYNPSSSYSQSLLGEFQTALKVAGGEIVETMNSCQQTFNLHEYATQIKSLKATAVALFPDGQTCDVTSLENTIALANTTRGDYPLFSSWTFESPNVFTQLDPAVFERIVVGSPWHYLSQPESDFSKNVQAIWGEQTFEDQVWAGVSATTYDAGKILVTALQNLSIEDSGEPLSQRILGQLRDPDFEVEGVTGQIQFLGSDRRQNNLVLLQAKVPQCPNEPRKVVPINAVQSLSKPCETI